MYTSLREMDESFFFFFFLTVSFRPFHRHGWVGDGEVIVLVFKTLCYAVNSLVVVNLHRKVCSFGKFE